MTAAWDHDEGIQRMSAIRPSDLSISRRAAASRASSAGIAAARARPPLRVSLAAGLAWALALTASGPAAADMIGHGGMVRALAISPDGRIVLTGSFDYTARLWDFVEQNEVAELNEHLGPVNAVAFLPDGRRALTVSDDRSAILWDLESSTLLRRFNGHQAKVMAVAVSRDGALAATGSWDRTLRLWNAATGELVRTIPQPSNVNAVAFGARGKVVVSGAHDGALRVWNTASGAFIGILEGHDWGVTQIAVSPDGTRLLSASTDETVRLWDLPGLSEIRTMKGHDGPVFGAVFGPDGKTALTAGRDGFIIHWNLATGRPIRAIQAHESPVWAVAFSPDGRFALSASSDERVRVWHLESGDQIGMSSDDTAEPKPWLESDHPGARLFRKCARCHSLGANAVRRSGPHFAGLFGRRAGSVPGYKYSSALVGADFAWSATTLRELFHDGPDAFLPGTKMPMQRIADDGQLAELIDYMREITAPGGADPGPAE